MDRLYSPVAGVIFVGNKAEKFSVMTDGSLVRPDGSTIHGLKIDTPVFTRREIHRRFEDYYELVGNCNLKNGVPVPLFRRIRWANLGRFIATGPTTREMSVEEKTALIQAVLRANF